MPDQRGQTEPQLGPAHESDEEFLARIRALGNDWRFSDEFIGLVVRTRYPAEPSA